MAGLGGDSIPHRCMRLVVLARLTNSMTGRGKLRPETVQSIAEMALEPPPVPLRTSAGSGAAATRRKQLTHQAPTSWRVLPNVLASAMQALDECCTAADISLRALKAYRADIPDQ
jgi:hypothetical protein